MAPLNRRALLAGAAAFGAAQAAFARPPRPVGFWTALADMPFAVRDAGAAPFWRLAPDPRSGKPRREGVLVNAGGVVSDGARDFAATTLVTLYDPITDQWTYGPALPKARHRIALVFNNGFVYAVNGFSADAAANWRMQASLWRLDRLDAPVWNIMTPPPIPQAEGVAVSLGGRVHLVGGRAPAGSRNERWGDHIDTDRHWAYDPGGNYWFPRRPMPGARHAAAGAEVDGFLFVIGGRTVDGAVSPDCDVYDPTADRWQPIAPLPRTGGRPRPPGGRSSHAVAVWERRLYAFGGEATVAGDSAVRAEVFEYDPREDKWRDVAGMPRPRRGLGAVTLNDGVYACGGSSGAGAETLSSALDRFEI